MAATFDLQHKCTFFNIGNYKNIVAFKLKQQIISFLNWVMRIFTAIWKVSNASIMGCYVLKKRPMYHPTFSTIHLTVALATWIFFVGSTHDQDLPADILESGLSLFSMDGATITNLILVKDQCWCYGSWVFLFLGVRTSIPIQFFLKLKFTLFTDLVSQFHCS